MRGSGEPAAARVTGSAEPWAKRHKAVRAGVQVWQMGSKWEAGQASKEETQQLRLIRGVCVGGTAVFSLGVTAIEAFGGRGEHRFSPRNRSGSPLVSELWLHWVALGVGLLLGFLLVPSRDTVTPPPTREAPHTRLRSSPKPS